MLQQSWIKVPWSPACDLGTPGLSSLLGNWSGCKTHVALQEMTSRDVLWGIQAYSCHLSALGTGGGRDREGRKTGEKEEKNSEDEKRKTKT